jgi:riboflavin biosynthesis pyrimidine reductase
VDALPPLQPLGPGAATTTARELVAGLDLLAGRDGGPRVLSAMITTADGRAAIGGRSVGLGHPADRSLLRELRAACDAILVGSRTLAAERYATLLDADQLPLRRARGQADHPVVATVTRRLNLDASVPLLAEEGVPIAVYTEADGQAPSRGADVTTHRMAPLDLAAVVAHLHAEFGARAILCEGGPGLLRHLVAAGALHDLLLTVAPMLAAGQAPAPLAGDPLEPPARMRLVQVHRADDHLFTHFAL